MKRPLLLLAPLLLLMPLGAGEYRQFGDFENAGSFKLGWRAREGRWAASVEKAALSGQHVATGRFSLQVGVAGSPEATYPYLEYRFPPAERDLSAFAKMHFRVFNSDPKPRRLDGFLRMPSLEDPDDTVRVFFHCTARPGDNRIAIGLGQEKGVVLGSATCAKADWRGVLNMQIYFDCPREDIHLHFDDFHFGERPAPVPDRAVLPRELVAAPFRGDWQAVPALALATTVNREPGRFPMTVRTAFDDDNLYFQFEYQGPRPARNKRLPRDDIGIWNHDSIEIFLRNDQETPDVYYQFVFDPAGNLYDSRITSAYPNPGWNQKWTAESEDRPAGWKATVALPWNIFLYSGTAAPKWWINIFRSKALPGGHGNLALSPTLGGYHCLDRMIPLRLPAPDMGCFCASIRSFQVARPRLGGNQADYEVVASRPARLQAVLAADGQRIQTLDIRTSAGPNRLRMPFVIPTPDRRRLELSLVHGGRTISRAECRIELPPVFTFRLDRPFYRNLIFHEESVEEIRGRLLVSLPAQAMEAARVRLQLLEDGARVVQESLVPARDEIGFAFQAGGLPIGRHLIRARLEDPRLPEECTAEIPLRRLPKAETLVDVDEDGWVRIDRRRTFLFMLHSGAEISDLPEIRKAGFNVLTFYAPYTQEVGPGTVGFIDAAAKYGIHCMPVFSHHVMGGPGRSLAAGSLPLIREQLKVFSRKRNVLGYDYLDEPNIWSTTVDPGYRKAYDLITGLDPYRPVHLVQCGEMFMPPVHQEICDIYDFDYYPSFPRNGRCLASLAEVPLRVRYLRSNLARGKCIVTTFAGYDRYRTGHRFELGRIANFTENRCQFYASYAEGARGLAFWPFADGSHGCILARPEWLGIARAVQELKAMLPALSAPPLARRFAVEGAARDNLHVAIRDRDGHVYVVAAYSGEREADLVFSGEAFQSLGRLQVIGEDRAVQVRGGRLADRFDAYDVHLYTDDPHPPRIRSPRLSRTESDRYEAEYRRSARADLIHRSFVDRPRSVRLSVTVDRTGKSPANPGDPYCLVDGIRRCPFYLRPSDLPCQIEVGLQDPIRANELRIEFQNSSYAREIAAEIRVEGEWRQAGRIGDNTGQHVSIPFPEQKTDRIRLRLANPVARDWLFIDALKAFRN